MESIQPDRILLLDSFFYVVVFHGTTIAQWRKEGYHLQEEHNSFRKLLAVGSAPLTGCRSLKASCGAMRVLGAGRCIDTGSVTGPADVACDATKNGDASSAAAMAGKLLSGNPHLAALRQPAGFQNPQVMPA